MMRVKIIFEDKDIIVIYKPAGLATQTAKVGQKDAVSELKNYLAKQSAAAGGSKGQPNAGQEFHAKQPSKANGQPYLGIIHRLDQPVEGLLVFAKNKKAAASLTSQLSGNAEGLLNKHYYAVVCGKPKEKTGKLLDYLDKDESGRAVIVSCGMSEESKVGINRNDASKESKMRYGGSEIAGICRTGKKAVLHYQQKAVAQSPLGEDFSLLDISIETGRFHQIRAQLANAGMPLLGDQKYGDEKSRALSEELHIRNVALCAYSLEFVHPVTGARKSFLIQPESDVFSCFDGK